MQAQAPGREVFPDDDVDSVAVIAWRSSCVRSFDEWRVWVVEITSKGRQTQETVDNERETGMRQCCMS